MNKNTSRKQQAMNTRLKILKTSIELFREKGMDAVKITDICREAGVSVGAFYHHFSSKESIIDRGYQSIDSFVEEKIKDLDYTSYSQRVLLLFREANSIMEDFGWKFIGDVYKYILSTGNQYTISQQRFPYQHIKNSLEEGITAGEFKKDIDTNRAAGYLMKLVRGITFDWCICEGSYSLVEEAAKTVKIVLNEYKL